MRTVCLALTLAVLAAPALGAESFVRGSVAASFFLPQMEMPRADDWAKAQDFGELEDHNTGELGDINAGWGVNLGYGVSLGPYFRFDAAVANVRKEHKVTYTGTDTNTGTIYNRDLILTTHILPVTLTGVFIAPGLFGDKLKPEFGLGVVTFIANYDTYQKIDVTVQGNPTVASEGNAWARDVAYGPEVRAGAGFEVFEGFVVEGAFSYYTAEASFRDWTRFGDAPIAGPAGEDLTGWAIVLGPRYYF